MPITSTKKSWKQSGSVMTGWSGNKARSLITQCAARMRPDIIYVKKPVYQCRFEGQDEFFNALISFLDPKTERDFLFEVRKRMGVWKCVVILKDCLREEGKSRCLGFLLGNHPLPLLHPYTKEWKAKLEEMELGCDAPDDDEDVGRHRESGEIQFTDWEEFQKALSSSDRMEKLVKRSVEVATEFYNEQLVMQADSSSSSSRPRG
ncbi:hypothetical protein GOBAR_AA01877 [Gossypium barbadense]|uniref:Uncharacterized protein n=1 Tax=Gossypium barbadense TaxID=3634 RepID=A0A2P5YT13_GOSBA|nr:hypothetical protein GOBAR_AA01877 [Gossypium barbadense]